MITASPTAPRGIVKHLTSYTKSDFPSGCAILCRNTAPVVSFAFSLIRRHIGCRILGRDIAEGLVAMVKKHCGGDESLPISDTLQFLSAWFDREFKKLEDKGWFRQANSLAEKVECLRIIAANTKGTSTGEFIRTINSLFTAKPDSDLITLCTIHKSKGLEWSVVFLLDSNTLMPSKFATQPWQLKQEKNLFYVAITRAKREFYYITSDKWIN